MDTNVPCVQACPSTTEIKTHHELKLSYSKNNEKYRQMEEFFSTEHFFHPLFICSIVQ